MTSFLFLMKNIYEYIHYIQSLKSIWTKRMSTWGCYFCCVCVFLFFFSFLFFSFGSLSPCEVCVFLKKILNVFQKKKKKDKKSMLIPDIFFFSSEDFKNGNKIHTQKKSKSKDIFLFTQWRRKKKNPGMETVEHTASTILVVQMVTKNLKERTLSIPYWSFGCLQATWIFVGAVIFLVS